jgi:hypothetical protein
MGESVLTLLTYLLGSRSPKAQREVVEQDIAIIERMRAMGGMSETEQMLLDHVRTRVEGWTWVTTSAMRIFQMAAAFAGIGSLLFVLGVVAQRAIALSPYQAMVRYGAGLALFGVGGMVLTFLTMLVFRQGVRRQRSYRRAETTYGSEPMTLEQMKRYLEACTGGPWPKLGESEDRDATTEVRD